MPPCQPGSNRHIGLATHRPITLRGEPIGTDVFTAHFTGHETSTGDLSGALLVTGGTPP